MQIVLLMFKMVYTVTRPAVLVYERRNEKKIKDSCINKDDSDEDEKNNKKKRR